MSSFEACNYTIFLNEQTRFDNLLNICKNNNEKIIIYTRYKYVTLLFSKLFNFNVNFYNSPLNYLNCLVNFPKIWVCRRLSTTALSPGTPEAP